MKTHWHPWPVIPGPWPPAPVFSVFAEDFERTMLENPPTCQPAGYYRQTCTDQGSSQHGKPLKLILGLQQFPEQIARCG